VNGWWLLTSFEVGLLDSASTLLSEELRFWHDLGVQVGVSWVVVLGLGVLVSDISGPGVLWCGPCAVGLDGNVVGSSDNSEETLFSEVSTPRVSDGPIFGSVFNTPTND
jgi:hypothetical protein